MSLSLELPPQMENRLREKASALGISAAEYVVRMLADKLEAPTAATSVAAGERDDWLDRFHQWVSSHDDLPTLPEEAFERESFYQDRS